MNNIFPAEIIGMSVETHFSKFNSRSGTIYITLIIGLVAAVFSLFFIKTDVVVTSKGIFRSEAEPVDLASGITGEVIMSVLEENRLVMSGDTLVWLNTQRHMERILHLKDLAALNAVYIKDLDNLMAGISDEFSTRLYQASYEEYMQRLQEFDINIQFLQKSYDRARHLFQSNVIPATEMEEIDFQLSKRIEDRKVYVGLRNSEWQKQAADYETVNRNYKSEIDGLIKDMNNYFITAPITGHVARYTGIKKGSFIAAGQVIATISPDENLIAETYVPPRDIGYLHEGMEVNYQVDAFNYTLWGMASGKIAEVSKEVYLVNNQTYFKVRSSINEANLFLKNGYAGELKKGFTTTSRFVVTRRTLAQLLFDKTDAWLNPKAYHY
jgi:membrane fusion protein, peptide pheromone/bacteriocin exporter